jgi:DNA-binding MarR family transcriptional regulator
MKEKNIWEDEQFMGLRSVEKLVFLYLLHNSGAEIPTIAKYTGLSWKNVNLISISLELKGLIDENRMIK